MGGGEEGGRGERVRERERERILHRCKSRFPLTFRNLRASIAFSAAVLVSFIVVCEEVFEIFEAFVLRSVPSSDEAIAEVLLEAPSSLLRLRFFFFFTFLLFFLLPNEIPPFSLSVPGTVDDDIWYSNTNT